MFPPKTNHEKIHNRGWDYTDMSHTHTQTHQTLQVDHSVNNYWEPGVTSEGGGTGVNCFFFFLCQATVWLFSRLPRVQRGLIARSRRQEGTPHLKTLFGNLCDAAPWLGALHVSVTRCFGRRTCRLIDFPNRVSSLCWRSFSYFLARRTRNIWEEHQVWFESVYLYSTVKKTQLRC